MDNYGEHYDQDHQRQSYCSQSGEHSSMEKQSEMDQMNCLSLRSYSSKKPHTKRTDAISGLYKEMSTFIRSKNGKVKQRLQNGQGYTMRAACVCIRTNRPERVLLVSSSKKSDKFVIPGGGIENGESGAEAAKREVYEEAGIRGQIIKHLNEYLNEESKSITTVFIFNVEYEDETWPEKSIGRKRKWMELDEAIDHLMKSKPRQADYLFDFKSELSDSSKSKYM
ncbi:hypothetical protein ACOME3_008479 [Neoechinorhynchus agilis]